MKNQDIANLARPLVNEELKEIVDNYAKGANKDNSKILQHILEVVDKIRTELDDQGKELSENTTATKNLRAEFEAHRDTINKRDKNHKEDQKDAFKEAGKDLIKNEVLPAVAGIVEPHKGHLRIKPQGIFNRILRRK